MPYLSYNCVSDLFFLLNVFSSQTINVCKEFHNFFFNEMRESN